VLSGAKPGKRDLTRRWDCAHGTYFGGVDDFRLWHETDMSGVVGDGRSWVGPEVDFTATKSPFDPQRASRWTPLTAAERALNKPRQH
jgi:hypothetical protein